MACPLDLAQLADPKTAAFHHEENPDVEREYDNLRALARAEADKRGDCYERVRLTDSRDDFLQTDMPSLNAPTKMATVLEQRNCPTKAKPTTPR